MLGQGGNWAAKVLSLQAEDLYLILRTQIEEGQAEEKERKKERARHGGVHL